MSSSQFDETDLSSYYFKGVKHEDAVAILSDQSEGIFLVRDSTRGSGYVVCVKENNTLMEYLVSTHSSGKLYIRPEFHFKDLPALLSFYKRNTFTTTALIRPVSKEKVLLHRHQFSNDQVSDRRTVVPVATFQLPELSSQPGNSRISAPPMSHTLDTHPPIYARVIKARTPISYDSQALTLKLDDIIRITRRSHGQGVGEILGTDKQGTFPLTHVETLRPQDLDKYIKDNS